MKRRMSHALAMRSTYTPLRVTQVRPSWSGIAFEAPVRLAPPAGRSASSIAASSRAAPTWPSARKKSMAASSSKVGIDVVGAGGEGTASDR